MPRALSVRGLAARICRTALVAGLLAAPIAGCAGEDEPESGDAADAVNDVITVPSDITTGWLDVGELPPPTPECATDEDCVTSFGDPGPCQTVTCATSFGQCLYVPLDDKTPCDDQNLCYTEQVCSGGLCLGGKAVDCSDGNGCTNDKCDLQDGCQHLPRVGSCDDGDLCTKDEYCKDGVCGNGADICPAQCGNGSCQTTKGETCESCPLDCGPCSDGCTESTFGGCSGCGCESCVCAAKPTCCTDAWTADCVAACEACGACTPCGDGVCDGAIDETCVTCPADCGACATGCAEREDAGCQGCACEACVCADSPFCCDVAWDAQCTTACETCGAACTGCSTSEAPGCNGCACESCVCDLIPSCCTGAWSALCVTACKTECGASCPDEAP